MGLGFDEAADFNYLKSLICEAASHAKIDLFDNVYDWSIMLTSQS